MVQAWLTSCGFGNAIFCFPCILFKTSACDSLWTKTGLTDLKHLSERIKKTQASMSAYEQLREASHARGKQLLFIPLACISLEMDTGCRPSQPPPTPFKCTVYSSLQTYVGPGLHCAYCI